MKKVLFFLESLAGGGAEKVLSDLVTHLDREKYDVTVCTVTDEGVYQEQVSSACRYRSILKMKDYRAGGIRKVLFWLGIKAVYGLPPRLIHRWLFREIFDVEVAFIEGYATKLIAASPNTNSRKLAWIHTDMETNNYAEQSYPSPEAHKAAYEAFDRICCVSQTVQEAFIRKFSLENTVCVQYNPVDEKAIRSKGLEPVAAPMPGCIRLGTIGRLVQQKGYLRLLACMNRLHREGYVAELWILGDGTQRSILEEYIESNALEDCVRLLGFQTNPYQYMAQCDAFVCSSYSEGFSTAATESLILGKPIFTVRCAGMEELFDGQACGIITDNTDEALYEMLKALVSGAVKPADYHKAVARRGEDFHIANRITEIQKILDGESP